MARLLLLGFAAVSIPVLSAVAAAAPATPEEAARLSTLFERYVGHPAPGEASSVTVVPKGDSYAVTLDLKRATAGLSNLGFTLDPYTADATLTPLPDGTWKVQSSGSPPLVVHSGAQTLTLAAATTASEGIYDPKIQAFSSYRQDQTGVTYSQTSPTIVQNRRTDHVVTTTTGAPAAGGTVAISGRYATTGTAADILVKSAAPDAGQPSGGNPAVPPPSRAGTAFSYTMPTGSIDATFDRLHVGSLLDLWAFLVAHPTHDSITAAQEELKTVLRAGLPFADGLKENSSAETMAITTPIGVVSMKSVSGAIDLAGLAGTGKASTDLSIADLVVPSGQLPPWSAGLVPTGLDLHLSVDGFHAAEAAAAAIGDIDLSKDVVITPDQKEAVGHVFWPGSGALALSPSRVTTKTLDLKMEGQATLGARPSGRVTIRGKGLDAEIAALQAQAAKDPGAAQVLGPLVLAKNLAKPDPDGTLVWVIDFGDGPVKINGAPLQ